MGENGMKKENSIKIFKTWIFTFIVSLAILAGMLFASAMIPRSAMYDNLKSSAEYYSHFDARELKIPNIMQTRQDIFADSILLNMINCTNSDKPVWSSIAGIFYSDGDGSTFAGKDLLAAVNGAQGRFIYSRYWHGSMLIIRLMLLFTDIHGIFAVNLILLVGLSILFCLLCYKTGNKRLIPAYIIGFVISSSFFAYISMEYMPVYIIMLIGAIAALYTKNEKQEIILFTLLGVTTAFFDFLTTETIAALIPLICILVRKNREERLTFKKGFTLSFKLLLIWFLSYALCFAVKWGISAAMLGEVAIQEIMTWGQDKFEGNSLGDSATPLPAMAVIYNLIYLLPISGNVSLSDIRMAYIIILIVLIVLFFVKKGRKEVYSDMGKLLLCAGLLPIIRYIVLANHACVHSYFTYRALIATVMCIALFFTYVFESSKNNGGYKKRRR